MKKNYYDLLEVSKNASPEVIEKVYKLLAKKYHPDLQPDDKKDESEEMFKKISIAYETLSNPKLRAEYDAKLEEDEHYSSINSKNFEENQKSSSNMNQYSVKSNNSKVSSNNIHSWKSPINSFFSNIKNKNENYSPIFTVKLPKLKDILIVSLFIIIAVLLLYIIPFTRNYFYSLYNKYHFFRIFVTLIKSIILGFFKTFETIFN